MLLSCCYDKTPDKQFKERRVSVGSQTEDLVHLVGKLSWQELEADSHMASAARQLGAINAGT